MSGWVRLLLLGLVACLAATASAAPPFAPAGPGERVVYRGATLIDGTGVRPRRDMAVVTTGERIEAVLPARRLRPGQLAGARVVDLAGRYLLPGLSDRHQHLATPPAAARALARRRERRIGLGRTREGQQAQGKKPANPAHRPPLASRRHPA